MSDLSGWDLRILGIVQEVGVLQIGDISRIAGLSGSKHSKLLGKDLLRLGALGLIRKSDDRKPVCWLRTKAGTEALETRFSPTEDGV